MNPPSRRNPPRICYRLIWLLFFRLTWLCQRTWFGYLMVLSVPYQRPGHSTSTFPRLIPTHRGEVGSDGYLS